MPDLEPITRDEKLWSGEDLEPITRREMYIKHLYDETQVIPEKPITREEMFILKAGEELHDVTIEQLTATENKTYSEEGVAYSPVIVNVPQTTLTTLDVTENGTYTAPSGTAYNEVEVDVPLPDNAYLLKEIEDVEIATFTDGSSLPMPKLEVAIEPVQAGSGDPSPTNIRPISGWSAVDVTIQDDIENPTTTETITIQLGSTYYGGKLDVVSGVLTVDSYGITITGIESFIYKNSNDASIYGLYVDSFPGRPYFSGDNASVMYRGVCSMFKKAYYLPSDQMQDHTIDSYGGGFGNTGLTGSWIRFKASSFADYTIEQAKAKLAEFYANGQPLQVVFPMVAQTIQLTPTQVNSLEGVNNINANSGKIINGQYFSKGE